MERRFCKSNILNLYYIQQNDYIALIEKKENEVACYLTKTS